MGEAGRPLVVGSDGSIGRALLRLPGALGSSRREVPEGGRLPLDLRADPAAWQLPSAVSVAYLCAGITSLAACEADPEGSARVNVDRTVELARRLATAGAFVVFLSTNLVFDGSVPRCPAETPCRPRTEYGRQKVRAEAALAELGEAVAIVRLTKVIGSGMPLFEGWRQDLAMDRIVQPFSDLWMAPLPLAFVAEALAALGSRRLPGLFQLSGERDLSYAEAARHLAARLGAAQSLVQPVLARESDLVGDAAPRHTTLDDRRFQAEFGLRPPAALEALEQGLGWWP